MASRRSKRAAKPLATIADLRTNTKVLRDRIAAARHTFRTVEEMLSGLDVHVAITVRIDRHTEFDMQYEGFDDDRYGPGYRLICGEEGEDELLSENAPPWILFPALAALPEFIDAMVTKINGLVTAANYAIQEA